MNERLAVIFPRLGPYHIARLGAAARSLDVTAIELSATDELHDWDPHENPLPFKRRTLFASTEPVSEARQQLAVCRALEASRPSAVAINGWAEPTSLMAMEWCMTRNVPMIVMSESSAYDASRTWWKEWVKRRIVKRFSAALVGGRDHAAYLESLGMDADRIAMGYDVVDNAYFARAAETARQNAAVQRQEMGLPEKYFLAVARFVPRKNLDMLMRAYAEVRRRTGTDWHLQIVGDGPQEAELLRLREVLGLQRFVHFLGFQQYDRLPTLYALSQALVHPSTSEQWGLVVNEAMACGLPVVVSNRCGCVRELVHEGRNGATFDPQNLQALTMRLQECVERESELSLR
ncbi:MAG: glycosyltransferase family 1 protein, partial [Planctomycetota bacterium]